MRAVVQRVTEARVTEARVTVDGEVTGEITEPGLCVLVGVTHDDTSAQADKLAVVRRPRMFAGSDCRSRRCGRARPCDRVEGVDMVIESRFYPFPATETTPSTRSSWMCAVRAGHSSPDRHFG
jgi:hypothetical protein